MAPHPWPPNTDFAILTGDSPWWMPDFLEKYIPTADTGKLDGAAEACRKAASTIRDLASGLHSKLQGLIGNNSSADVDELEQFWQRAAGPQSILTGLPQALDDVANSLVDFRIWNDNTQQAIKDKIKAVVDSLGVVGLVLFIGSILTDGGLDAIIAAVVETLEFFSVDAEGALAAPIIEVATTAETALVVGGAVAIAKGVEPAIQAAMSSTPNPNVEGLDATKISDELGAETRPLRAPDPNAKPGGRPKRIKPNEDAEVTRSLERENEFAVDLARAGYDVEQNPSVPGPKNPDYLINGKIFDCYAPSTSRARNIADAIEDKIKKGQTERIALNMKDIPVDLDAMRAQLQDWPVPGLKEVIAMDKQGNIVHLYP